MNRVLKIFLPYSLLAGIGVAIWASNYRPHAEPVVIQTRSGSAESQSPETAACYFCGNEVDPARALRQTLGDEVRYYCCGGCMASAMSASTAEASNGENATGEPRSALAAAESEARREGTPRRGPVSIDPVCHMEVNEAWGFQVIHDGQSYYFCTKDCRDRFAASPDQFLGDRCLVCKKLIDPATATEATYMDQTYRFCSEEHRRQFQADPAAHFMHTMWGIPPWMYYLSIAFVLVVSFGLFEVLDRWFGQQRPTYELARSVGAAAVPALAVPSTGPVDRIDLMRSRVIRTLLTSRVFRFVCQAVFVLVFFVIIAAGLFGNQNPALNIAPILTWTVWWGGLVILIMYAGKAWCYVCPWDAVAGWMEKMRLWKKADEGLGLGLKWPRALRNIVIATVLFVGLTWVELGFGVTMKPRVTAYLAIAMLLMAIVCAFLFERKGFCRYACLVGRVSGLYAMFSGIEIRPRDQAVCKGCSGKECAHGSESAYGCPTFLFPGNLRTNTYCIQCTECLQACPHDNLAVNLRPWGADLVTDHRPRTDEAYLALLMLSITGFHGLTMTPNWGRLTGWLTETFSLSHLVAFSLGMAGLMLAPILVYAVLVKISYALATPAQTARRYSYHDYFVRYAYALLPIALFYHLAHNLEHLLMEGPKIVALASDPFGWGWNLFGTLGWTIPPLVSLDVLWILQIVLVLVGHVYSLWLAQRTSTRLFGDRKAALRSQLPMLVGMIAFSIFSLWLLKQPMEMRTSAM
ncbi:MAG: YHS domain-containing protein [Planctomycetes bacterium]|nr:YHS domain-containing protein [Planctomycetota bacterium]